MENKMIIFKAVADETRLKIVKLLLKHNYCVGALARQLKLTEAAISQHLKTLREAGLLKGEKRGYFMHYDVNREVLLNLSAYIKELANIQKTDCKPEDENCTKDKQDKCHVQKSGKKCSDEVQHFCHGTKLNGNGDNKHEHCQCNKS